MKGIILSPSMIVQKVSFILPGDVASENVKTSGHFDRTIVYLIYTL